jgi:hypothetical protein
VKTVLAAGKVTSATPWTTAATLTTATSVRRFGVTVLADPGDSVASGRVPLPGVTVSAQPLQQVLADPKGVGDDGERGVDGTDGDEEARIDHVEVVELVGLAVDVEH